MNAASQLYPVALNLRGKTCVVVGGGAVGARKAQALYEAGARVIVVAPEAGKELAELVAARCVEQVMTLFEASYLDGAFLVIAATNRPGVNAAVAQAARERGILLNLAAPASNTEGNEEDGDFVTMASVRRGDLLLALTTGGAGPALSARLKRDLETQFGAEWEPYVALLREMREKAYQRFTGQEAAEALRRIVARDTVRTLIASGDTAAAREEALSCLSR